jgi:hypothetical protein
MDDAIDDDREDDDVVAPVREGLPPAFRMRHARHCVEQVMGDAPIRTVREIALQDIEGIEESEAVDLHALESSIRAIGVLEPLLVRPAGKRYHLIAGARRLRAAVAAGLRTVPCLVQDVDDEMARRIRDAVSVRTVPVLASVTEPAAASIHAPALTEAGGDSDFVAALAPLLSAAGADPLRRSVLSDLASSELARARCVAECAGVPEDRAALERTAVNVADILRSATAAILPEARLRGVRVEVSALAADYSMSLEGRLVTTAVTAMLHGALALTQGSGSALRISMQGTTIRPAFILEVVLDDVEMDPHTARHLFEGDVKPHPCGPSGALLMSTVRRVARMHGGRADAQVFSPRGCALTFVVPRPLSDL